MKIACIGWGSLVWNPGDLPIKGDWIDNGPYLPLEFVRQSQDGRLTLVIAEKFKVVGTLWALMITDELEDAQRSLLLREGISSKRINEFIGSVRANDNPSNSISLIIKNWLIVNNLDAAIWTNLPPKFNNQNGKIISVEEAVSYLKNLESKKFDIAMNYIKKAPIQINTGYRKVFEQNFKLLIKNEIIMNENFQKISDTLKYARENNIDPKNPNTWDQNYKKRQQELAGIIPKIEESLNSIKEGISLAKETGQIE